jgi:hypothetical protein
LLKSLKIYKKELDPKRKETYKTWIDKLNITLKLEPITQG